MKPKDIFKAQIEHRETATVPYTVDFDGEIDLQLDDYYGSTAWRDSIQTFRKVAAEPDKLVIRVSACAICGTDLRAYRHGSSHIDPPRTISHEITGISDIRNVHEV